jgi:pSer/pThr/pTyr-binding forkhead associated (FHA) protein
MVAVCCCRSIIRLLTASAKQICRLYFLPKSHAVIIFAGMGYTQTTTQAHLEIISPTGEIHFYPLQPGRSIRLGQRPENELALNSPGIAPFHLLFDYHPPSYRLLLLSSTEETRLNGQLLRPHSTTELRPLDLINVGDYSLILLPAQPEVDNPAATPPINPPPVPPGFADPIGISLSSRHAWVEVAQTATYHATLTNHTMHEITALVSVDGVDPNWLTIAPSQVKLKPGEQMPITLTITPPPSPTSSAGSHSLAVAVASPDYPGWRTYQEAILIIKPCYDFALSDLTPKQQHLARFLQTGQAAITLTNKSNCPALFELSGADEAKVCHFEFQLPEETASLVATAELRLPAGQTTSIPIRITPPPRPWIRPGRCSYPYTLTVTLLDGRQTSRSVSGQVSSAPLVGPWLITLVTFCLVVLAGLGAQLFIEQTWLRPVFLSLVTPTPTPLPHRPAATATPTPNIPPAATPALTYEEIFQKVALQYGLDWRMLAELAYRESRMNPFAVGRDNDMGLMQIVPSTWNEWAPKVGVSDPFDPYSNVLVAGAYLAYLRSYCQARGYQETQWMLVGYNWGPDNLGKLFESEGDWEQVPEKQRYYALNIVSGTGIYRAELTQKALTLP